jgi:outer membrane receptor protein involved in Fe transport
MSETNSKSKRLIKASIVGALLGSTAFTSVAFGAVDEIVVTATRRAASVREIPYNISAVTGETLVKAGITGIGDLSRAVPGLNYNDRGSRGQMFSSGLVIRGMNADRLARISAPLASVSPVSTYIGETPIFVNLDMMDIERVEVLRGPQGTLYGSGSLGGTIRFIQNDASTDEYSASMNGGISSFSGSDDLNYEVGGIVNMPVNERFALRLNARHVNEAGFIDQPNLYVRDSEGEVVIAEGGDFLTGIGEKTSEDDVNTNEMTSLRAAAYFELSDTLRAKLNLYYQQNESGGANTESYSFYGKGSQKNAHYINETYDGDVKMASLEIEKDFGFATLTSSTSVSKAEGEGTGDLTGLYENFTFFSSYYGEFPRALVASESGSSDEAFTQEIRLVSNGEGPFDWVIGAFYQKREYEGRYEDTFEGLLDWHIACELDLGVAPFYGSGCGPDQLFQDYTVTPTGVVLEREVLYQNSFQNEFKNMALYGELTYHFSDAWQATGGFRAFDQEFDVVGQSGYAGNHTHPAIWFNSADPFAQIGENSNSSSESDVLFKFNTSYDINDDTMVYVTWSEGFRRGGANGLPPTSDPAALVYTPDMVTNTEVGIKGLLGDNIQYTLAVFSIDWEDIQVNRNCGANFGLCVVNAGEAKSEGLELEINAQLTDHFRLDAGYSYTDARIETVDTPGVLVGKQLPGAPKNSFNATAWYETTIHSDMDMTLMLNGSYRSDRTSQIVESLDVAIDDYWMWNASAALGKNAWTARLYVNNITDEEGYMSAYSTANTSGHWGERAYALRSKPRTIGVNVRYNFN